MSGRWEGEVSIELGGRTYTGLYRVDDKGMLHVSYGGDSKSERVGGHLQNPKVLAERLLREQKAVARKDGAA